MYLEYIMYIWVDIYIKKLILSYIYMQLYFSVSSLWIIFQSFGNKWFTSATSNNIIGKGKETIIRLFYNLALKRGANRTPSTIQLQTISAGLVASLKYYMKCRIANEMSRWQSQWQKSRRTAALNWLFDVWISLVRSLNVGMIRTQCAQLNLYNPFY